MCTTGTYDWSFALHDPASSPGATDAEGPCHALGPDVSGASGCGAFPSGAQRLTAAANGELPVVDDTVTVTMTGGSLGTSNLRVTATGVSGSLDDGSLHVRGTRRQPVMASISSPRGPLPALKATRTLLTNASGVADLGPERNPFTLHVGDGATVSLSGAGIGSVPIAFSYRLAASLSGAVLSGSASPGARVLVAQDQGTRIDQQVVTAAGSGAFTATLRDPAPGDRVVVSAGDAATHGVTTLSLIVRPRAAHSGSRGSAACTCRRGNGDRGRAPPARACCGAATSGALGGTTFALPVDRVPDGPARVTATAVAGPSSTDYLYVLVDSTAPTGGAGPDQTVPVGRRAVFVTQAHDANGLAAVRFRFTAKGNGVGQPVNQLGQPFRHAFTKVGTYAVTVTITDLAGNTTSDRAIVRVVRGLSSAITGRWPRARRDAPASARSSARASRATSRSSSYAPTAASPLPARSRSTRRASARRSRSRCGGCAPAATSSFASSSTRTASPAPWSRHRS
jgi:hypothetical protein